MANPQDQCYHNGYLVKRLKIHMPVRLCINCVQLCQLKLSPQFAELEVQVPVKNSAHGTIGHRLVESHFRLQPTVAHVSTYRRSGQAPTRLNKERAVSAIRASLHDIACARIKPDHAISMIRTVFWFDQFPRWFFFFFGQGSRFNAQHTQPFADHGRPGL